MNRGYSLFVKRVELCSEVKEDVFGKMSEWSISSVVQTRVSFQPNVVDSCMQCEPHNSLESLWNLDRDEKGDNVLKPIWKLQSNGFSDFSPNS